MKPRDGVAHLEASVLDGAREAVPGSRATEREQVAAGLEDAQALGGPFDAPIAEGSHGLCVLAAEA